MEPTLAINVGGAINLITDIDYQNNFSFSGFIGDDIAHAQDNNSKKKLFKNYK